MKAKQYASTQIFKSQAQIVVIGTGHVPGVDNENGTGHKLIFGESDGPNARPAVGRTL